MLYMTGKPIFEFEGNIRPSFFIKPEMFEGISARGKPLTPAMLESAFDVDINDDDDDDDDEDDADDADVAADYDEDDDNGAYLTWDTNDETQLRKDNDSLITLFAEADDPRDSEDTRLWECYTDVETPSFTLHKAKLRVGTEEYPLRAGKCIKVELEFDGELDPVGPIREWAYRVEDGPESYEEVRWGGSL